MSMAHFSSICESLEDPGLFSGTGVSSLAVSRTACICPSSVSTLVAWYRNELMHFVLLQTRTGQSARKFALLD